MCPPQYNQSNEILSCSNGIGTKLSNTIDLEASSGSVCGGTSSRMRSGLIDNSMSRYRRRSATFPYPERRTEIAPSRVKSNKRGNSFPLGILAPSPRSSSKNGWHIASIALRRASGVYSSSFETRSMASAAVRGRKTLG